MVMESKKRLVTQQCNVGSMSLSQTQRRLGLSPEQPLPMLSRLTPVRRIPRVFATPIRLYTDARKEGTVAQSKGFRSVGCLLNASSFFDLPIYSSAKEKAHEGMAHARGLIIRLLSIRRSIRSPTRI
jgi:hypothetical protein